MSIVKISPIVFNKSKKNVVKTPKVNLMTKLGLIESTDFYQNVRKTFPLVF